MKIVQTLLKSMALPILVAFVGAFWLGGRPAQAAETWSSTRVPIDGTVTGGPESVYFSGQAQVNSRLARDPDFGSPSIVLSINLSGVSGQGLSSRKKYAISGPEIVQRRLASWHLVEITFPFSESSATATSAPRAGVASFALNIDVNTGAVTTATANVVTPGF